ncbi:C-X-C motif chemokine 9-like [Sinocyclocheilus rhinocerous]|uniref:C-X-C motif chemokine 9-like n=1 Tax=Sinocyclocheilus rhinocerous TaxID=307959 RepID=UPI0007B9BD3C|nr:PREDICTED: C-X-C motif chemokine 9-like [Sinocyclocheilus rhinocerous]
MTLTVYALLTFTLSILLTVQVVESQYVPKTCQCPQVKQRVKGPFSDFKVTLKRPNCLQDEIIVTRQKNNSLVCLSPDGPQGKRLLKCWQSMQNDGKDSKKCIRRQKQKPRRRNRKQVKSRKVKS